MKIKNKKIGMYKEKIASTFDLPKEILLNQPFITIIGTCQITIENFKGILEYTELSIKIKTAVGTIKIDGKNLSLKEITSDNIEIKGNLQKIEYIL